MSSIPERRHEVVPIDIFQQGPPSFDGLSDIHIQPLFRFLNTSSRSGSSGIGNGIHAEPDGKGVEMGECVMAPIQGLHLLGTDRSPGQGMEREKNPPSDMVIEPELIFILILEKNIRGLFTDPNG